MGIDNPVTLKRVEAANAGFLSATKKLDACKKNLGWREKEAEVCKAQVAALNSATTEVTEANEQPKKMPAHNFEIAEDYLLVPGAAVVGAAVAGGFKKTAGFGLRKVLGIKDEAAKPEGVSTKREAKPSFFKEPWMLYSAIGGGVLILVLVAYFFMRSDAESEDEELNAAEQMA